MKRIAQLTRTPLTLAAIAAAAILIAGPAANASTFLSPTDFIKVSDNTKRNDLGSIDEKRYPSGTPFRDYEVRERNDYPPDDKQIVTFLQFDVSSFSSGTIQNATFSVFYHTDLNGNAPFDVFVGRNDQGTWNSTSGTEYPLHDWAFDDDDANLGANPTVVAKDGKVLTSNTNNETDDTVLSVDVTDIVSAWVDAPATNQGFVMYYDGLDLNQGAGFSDAELKVTTSTVIPLPAAAWSGFVLLGGIGLVRRFKRQG